MVWFPECREPEVLCGVFGVDDALIAAAVAAAASTGGAMMNNQARENQASSASAQNWRQAAWQFDRAWEMQEDAQQFQMDEAQRVVNRTEYLTGTAYQRAMKDMRAAGLNPMLAFQQGGAGSSASATAGGAPQGSTGGVAPVPVPQRDDILGPAVASAMQVSSALTSIEQMRQSTAESEARTRVANAQEHATNAETGLRVAQTSQTAESERLTRELQRTEAERQANLRSSSALNFQSAEESEARTRRTRQEEFTERERTGLVDAQRQRAMQDFVRERSWGVSPWGQSAASAEAALNRMFVGPQSGSAVDDLFRFLRTIGGR